MKFNLTIYLTVAISVAIHKGTFDY